MATFKHISSKNANYGDAEKYLTFAHDEFSMKPTLDENGRLVPREDYRISTMNCGEEDFAIACMRYFRLRPSIHPATYTDIYARSLYAAEDGDMNKLEQKLIVELTALPNVRWWHRKRLSMRSVSVFTRSHIAFTSRSAVNTSP